MAISRPFLLALLGAVLLGATLFAVQNARNSASDDAAPAAQVSQPSRPRRRARAASNPEDSLKSSLNGTPQERPLQQRDLSISGLGQTGSRRAVSGAFETPAQGEVAAVRGASCKADGAGTDVDVGLVSTGDQALHHPAATRLTACPQSAWNQVIQAASKAETPARPGHASLQRQPHQLARAT